MAAHLHTPRGRTPCLVENVSLGGLFVRTDRLEEVGTEVAVDLVKPGWKKRLSVEARVTSRIDALDGRKRMPGLGMQFVRVDVAQHERLRSMMRELGAPDEEADVTLPEESTEAELRELGVPDAEPLEPHPQPLWQQVQLVEESIAQAVEDVAPPPPLTLAPALPAEPADLSARSSLPARNAPLRPAAAGDDQVGRLQIQLRGLVMQLSDAQHQIAQRDAEIERLREELSAAQAALERALRDG
jgi:Tfp pilus assembly protein PilZ